MSNPTGESILIFDFGSQYAQLIARRVRDLNVFCQIVRHDLPASRVAELNPKGIILSGGPSSVYEAGAPRMDPAIFGLNVPILGLCYGINSAADPWSRVTEPSSRVRAGANSRHQSE